MTLKETIIEDLKSSMKEKNTIKLNTLRVLKGEIERNEQSSKGKIILSDNDIIKLIKKLIISIKETNGTDSEILSLETYLPKQMEEMDIKQLVLTMVLNDEKLGDIMKYFKTNFDGLYDGKVLNNIVKESLTITK